MTTIIDYGIGNLRSIEKALLRVGAEVHRTDDPQAVRDAERLVLPGVGPSVRASTKSATATSKAPSSRPSTTARRF
jgi:imidazoleglycerol phosphate synthase glutamine amidotransferase subunit HisH